MKSNRLTFFQTFLESRSVRRQESEILVKITIACLSYITTITCLVMIVLFNQPSEDRVIIQTEYPQTEAGVEAYLFPGIYCNVKCRNEVLRFS